MSFEALREFRIRFWNPDANCEGNVNVCLFYYIILSFSNMYKANL